MLNTALHWLKSGWVSTTLAALMIALYFFSLILPSLGLETALSASWDGPVWDVFTAPLAVRSLAQLIFDVILLLTMGVFLERALGWRAYLLIGTLSYWFAALLALWASELIRLADPAWAEALQQERIVGIAALLLSVAAAASIRLAPLWRRRIQTFVITVLLMLILFGGYLSALFTILATLLGLLFGRLLYGSKQPRRKGRDLVGAGPQDGRSLIALVIAGVVIGTVVAHSTGSMVGILAHLQYLADAELTGVTACGDTPLDNCDYYQGLLGPAGMQLLAPSLLQLALAWGLRRGRAIAWVGTVWLQSTILALSMVNLVILWGNPAHWAAFGMGAAGPSLGRLAATIAVPLMILALVVPARGLFNVRTGLPALRLLRTRMAMWVVAAWVATLVISLLLTGFVGAQRTLLGGTAAYLLALLPAPSLAVDLIPAGISVTMAVAQTMSLVPWGAAIVLVLRAFQRQELPQAISRSTFVDLTKRYGAGSLGWMSTWEGNHYWGAPDLQGAVAYRSGGGVALTVTDPVAAPGKLSEVMEEFVSFSLQQGLTPAFYSVHQDAADVAGRWGWPRLAVAEETVLKLAELSFTGKKFQAIRTALNRAEKEGVRAEWVSWANCPPEWKKQVESISRQWVDDKPLPEMGFTLGGLAELDDPDVRILLAVGPEDTVQGITSWMPNYENGQNIGFTLDFMRRLEGGFRPVMEFLIAWAALWAKEQGYRELSLSGAPLARVEAADDRSDTEDASATLTRVLDFLGQTLEPVYGFRSLLKFKAKFRPEYEALYLTVPTLGSLPFVGLAIGIAYLPDMSFSDTVNLGKTLRKR